MTPDEATEALHRAIAEHATAHGLADPDDEILSEWAIISNWQPIEAGDSSRYVTQFTTDHPPMHVAAGLFEVGANVIWQESHE